MPGSRPATQGRLSNPTPPRSRLRSGVPRWVTAAFSLTITALIAIYVLNATLAVRGTVYFLGHVISAVVFGIGLLSARRGFRRDWHLMLAAMWLWVLGESTAVFNLDGQGMPRSWALGVSLALGACVLMTLGMIRLAQRDGLVRGSAVWLDGAVYLVATSVGWWLLVGQDMFAPGADLTPGILTGGIAPIGDGLLLAGASALTSSRAAHTRSARALIGFALAGLLGDFGFARQALGHGSAALSLVPVLWMLQFLCGGLAALNSGHSVDRRRDRMPTAPLVLLTSSLVLPSLFAAYAAVLPSDGLQVSPRSLTVVFAGTGLMVVLVSVRARLLMKSVEEQATALAHSARTDELTGLPNRRAGDRLLNAAVAAAHVHGEPLHVALVDLDHFKRFNDTFGHQHGDRLLQAAGKAWPPVLGEHGTVFRYGGEEFVVLLPDSSTPEGVMRDLQAATPFDQTFSAGLVSLRPGEDAQSLIGRADVALYAAKAAGRARTVLAA